MEKENPFCDRDWLKFFLNPVDNMVKGQICNWEENLNEDKD
jgi:hypothetical protein